MGYLQVSNENFDSRAETLQHSQREPYTWTGKPEFVSLWGTEKAYRCQGHGDPEDPQFCDWPGPNCIDGYFYWMWWRAKAALSPKPRTREHKTDDAKSENNNGL